MILGILDGAYVEFGAQIATTVVIDGAKYKGLGISKVTIGAVFFVGLMLAILGDAELFTGNSRNMSIVLWRGKDTGAY